VVARKHPLAIVRPSVTVLQLDTDFPRVPGDVGCPDTYIGDVEILRIPNATVGQIVSADPAAIPIAPFKQALRQAMGDLIVTSCGFLSYWQTHLQAQTDRPFISSALTALPGLLTRFSPRDILTVTFDADSLSPDHFGEIQPDVIGLPKDSYLRQVISHNSPTLDQALARQEVADFVAPQCKPHHKHILLECTNLPPYKSAITSKTGLDVSDILTCIESKRPGTIAPMYLAGEMWT
jgi:hypothetical protein